MTDLQSTIDTYLDAYGEANAERRSDLVRRVWATDGHLIDPPINGCGHDGISAMAATVQSHYAGHVFRRTSGIDEHHSFARYEWELVAPDGTSALVGLDVAEIDDAGRLRRIVGFLGPIPPKEG